MLFIIREHLPSGRTVWVIFIAQYYKSQSVQHTTPSVLKLLIQVRRKSTTRPLLTGEKINLRKLECTELLHQDLFVVIYKESFSPRVFEYSRDLKKWTKPAWCARTLLLLYRRIRSHGTTTSALLNQRLLKSKLKMLALSLVWLQRNLVLFKVTLMAAWVHWVHVYYAICVIFKSMIPAFKAISFSPTWSIAQNQNVTS